MADGDNETDSDSLTTNTAVSGDTYHCVLEISSDTDKTANASTDFAPDDESGVQAAMGSQLAKKVQVLQDTTGKFSQLSCCRVSDKVIVPWILSRPGDSRRQC